MLPLRLIANPDLIIHAFDYRKANPDEDLKNASVIYVRKDRLDTLCTHSQSGH